VAPNSSRRRARPAESEFFQEPTRSTAGGICHRRRAHVRKRDARGHRTWNRLEDRSYTTRCPPHTFVPCRSSRQWPRDPRNLPSERNRKGGTGSRGGACAAPCSGTRSSCSSKLDEQYSRVNRGSGRGAGEGEGTRGMAGPCPRGGEAATRALGSKLARYIAKSRGPGAFVAAVGRSEPQLSGTSRRRARRGSATLPRRRAQVHGIAASHGGGIEQARRGHSRATRVAGCGDCRGGSMGDGS